MEPPFWLLLQMEKRVARPTAPRIPLLFQSFHHHAHLGNHQQMFLAQYAALHPSLWSAGTCVLMPGGTCGRKIRVPILTALEETGGFLWLAALISSELQEQPCTPTTAISRWPVPVTRRASNLLTDEAGRGESCLAMHAYHSTKASCRREGCTHILGICPGIHAAPGSTDAHDHQRLSILQYIR